MKDRVCAVRVELSNRLFYRSSLRAFREIFSFTFLLNCEIIACSAVGTYIEIP